MTPCVCTKCGEFVSLHACKAYGRHRRHLICLDCWRRGHRPTVIRESGGINLRIKAWMAVSWAKRNGKLKKKPCIVCGTMRNLTTHHYDYTRPLRVLWACQYCHKQHHAGLINLLHYKKESV